MTPNEPTFELTDDHINLLRELVFLWMDAGEAGVPMAYGYSATYYKERDRVPYEPLDRYTDMTRILGLNDDPANLSADQREGLIGLIRNWVLPSHCSWMSRCWFLVLTPFRITSGAFQKFSCQRCIAPGNCTTSSAMCRFQRMK